MTKFYTRTGDDGTTGILGEGRVMKFDLRMEALGALDELSAAMGLIRSALPDAGHQSEIIYLQRKLYELMAEVAASPENAAKFYKVDLDSIAELERLIDEYSKNLAVPQGFIIAGDTQASAAADFARTLARRAERRVAELLNRGDIGNKNILGYLNRLSSFLFVLEIKLIQEAGKERPLPAQDNIQ